MNSGRQAEPAAGDERRAKDDTTCSNIEGTYDSRKEKE